MKKTKIIIFSLFLMMIIPLAQTNVYAKASYSMSVSSRSVSSGGTVTVSVSGVECEGSFKVTASNGAKIKGHSTIWTGESTQIQAPSSGSFTISVTPVSVTSTVDASRINYLSSKSTTVTVKSSSSGSNNTNNNSGSNSGGSSNNSNSNNTNNNNDTKPTENLSKDNNLASLTVSEGNLSPKFSADTTKYSMTLSSNVKEITVSAKAKDVKAKVSGTGKKNLSFGKNEIYVVCTAENGSKKTYSILVTVDETPDTFMNFGDAKLGIVKNLSDIDLPHKSFEESKVTYDGAEVTAWTSNQMEKTIVYLMNDDGEKNFYLFDDGKITSKFVPVTLAGIPMFVVDIAKDSQTIPEMKYQALEIDKKEVMGWVYDDKKLENYELLSLMQENGKMQYYLHEKTNDTYMLSSNDFFNQAIELSEMKDANDSLTLTRNIFIGTTVVAVAGCAVLGYLYFSFKKKSISAIKDYYSKKTQD